MNISFLTEEDKADAQAKADERNTTVSVLVQKYFKKLPRLSK